MADDVGGEAGKVLADVELPEAELLVGRRPQVAFDLKIMVVQLWFIEI